RFDSHFLQGRAIVKYFFFIDDRKKFLDVTDRQAQRLRAASKLLKRSRKVGNGQFIALAHEILDALGENESTLIILRVICRANQRFAEACRQAYASNRSLSEVAANSIDAEDLGRIEAYQRERIQIDVVYRDPNNQELIDEYK